MGAVHQASLQLLLMILLSSMLSISSQSQSSNTFPASGDPVTGMMGMYGTVPGWTNMILNATSQFDHGARNQSSKGNSFLALRQLMLRLPGLVRGLTAVDPRETDVGKILADLFSNPRLTEIPKWIKEVRAASNTSLAGLEQDINSLSMDDKTQAMLLEVFTNISKELGSLNLNTSSPLQEIISAILSQPDLMALLSSETRQMLGQMQQQTAGSTGLSQILEMLGGASALQQLFPTVPGSQCAADLTAFGTALLHRELWAFRMLDAMGKPVAGLLTGQNVLVGDFDQCVDISVKNGSRTIEGQFCNMAFTVPGALTKSFGELEHILPDLGPVLHMQLCLPKSCSENHLYHLFQPSLESIGSKQEGIQCHHPRDPTEDSRFISVVATLAVLAALCLAGTFYSAVLDSKRDQKKHETLVKTTTYVNSAYVSDEKAQVVSRNHVSRGLTSGKTGISDDSNVNEGLTNGKAGISDASNVTVELTNGKTGISDDNNVNEGLTSEKAEQEKQLEAIQVEAGMANGQNNVVGKEAVNGQARHFSGAAIHRTVPGESLLSKLLLSFSVLRNGRKVLNTEQSQADISCLHGIRVLSITWVILGHCFSMLLFSPAQGNNLGTFRMLTKFTAMALPGGLMAVDTFFLLSGCLTAIIFLRSAKKTGVTVSSMVLYYVHRYWRLTPLYALLIAVYVGIFPYLKRGPFEHLMISMDSETNCHSYWHYNILYVNNLVKDSFFKTCFAWSWYLSNDMQFSVLAPLVLIPWTFRWPGKVVGFMLCATMILTHCISTGIISYREDASMFKRHSTFMERIYFVPWCRIGPYAIGLMLGYIMNAIKGKYTMDKLSVFLGWTIATALGVTLVYVHYDNVRDMDKGTQWTAAESAGYESVNKVLWALCVSWVVFACSSGYGGFVNTLLSWKAWMPLSRLTYGVYLVHLIIMFLLAGNFQKPMYLDSWTVTQLMLAVTVLSFLVSFFFSMLIEAPTLGLEKAVLGKIFGRKC